MRTLLVVDDEPNILRCFQRVFQADDLRVLTAETAKDALALAARRLPDVTVLDLCLPDGNGVDVFRALRELDPRALVILITAHGRTDTAIEAMKEGAFDYLPKPLEVAALRNVVNTALRIRGMMRRPALSIEPSDATGEADVIMGRGPAMQMVYKAIGRVAPQNVNVLLLGESGTGKELVARAIYHHSRRAERPFLAINCAAIPEALLESELFGHEQGAFTGADRRRIGRFEQCDGGTLFLDEVGDLGPALQAKLLRVLQDQSFQRLGNNQTLRSDVRIIAATNCDLEALVAGGRFRMDLYFRLADFVIQLPPLRDRLEDLPDLVQYLVTRLKQSLGSEVTAVPDETLALLSKHRWPGNIRELQNVLRTSLLCATGSVLAPEFVPAFRGDDRTKTPLGDEDREEEDFRRLFERLLGRGEPKLYQMLVRRLDRLVLELALERTAGNQVRASRMLGITRNTLRAKLKSLAMDGAVLLDAEA
jgi:two-component system nitrogen regulation response regulator GlnG